MRNLSLASAAVAIIAASSGAVRGAPILTDATPGLSTITLAAGTYDIVATGASGGMGYIYNSQSTGGLGAVVEGKFTFTTSETLSIVVGGQGLSILTTPGSDTKFSGAGGGGGGTFVVASSLSPLLIAGGGGGGAFNAPFYTQMNGANGGGIAKSGGAGGVVGSAAGEDGAGGGGLYGDGGGYPLPFGNGGGSSYADGSAGGKAATSITHYGVIANVPIHTSGAGGFGGGGGGGGDPFGEFGGGGGGGGYTGGDGGLTSLPSGLATGGGGGTSFDIGSDPMFSIAPSQGDGSIVITLIEEIPTTPVPEPGSAALTAVGLLGLGIFARRRA